MNTKPIDNKKYSINLKRPAFLNQALLFIFLGYFLGFIIFASEVFLFGIKQSINHLIMLTIVLTFLIIISIIVKISLWPRTEPAIEFYPDRLLLPTNMRFSRPIEVEYSDIYSVVMRGKKLQGQLLIDIRKKIFTYYFKDFVSLTSIEQFLEVLETFVKAQPNGESHWQKIQGQNAIFIEVNKRKGIVVWLLCVILLAVFSVEMYMGPSRIKLVLLDLGANVPILVHSGQWFRLFNSNFLHLNFNHLILNIAALAIIGLILERLIGWWRFLLIYLISALGGAIASMLLSHAMYSIGASTAIYGLIGALAVFNLKFYAQLPAVL